MTSTDRTAELVITARPWQDHIAFMHANYGRRDPACRWCGESVWMALQGFYAGGPVHLFRDEGPLGTGCPPGTDCPSSPDGQHDVLTRQDKEVHE